MVQVPSAASQGLGTRELQPLNIPKQSAAGATPAAFGAGQAKQLGEFGKALFKIKDEQDKAQGYEAYAKASEEAREMLNNPEGGIYSKKGSDALTAHKDAKENMDGIFNRATEGMSDGAKLRFGTLWRTKNENVLNSVSRYEVQERNAYKQNAMNATISTARNDAIENYSNPEVVSDSLAVGEFAIRDNMNGQPPKAVALKIAEFKSDTHSDVINRMVIDDSLGAKAYYDKTKKQITGAQQIVIEKVLDVGTTRDAAVVATTEILAKGKDEKTSLAEARKLKNNKVRDATVARIEKRFSEGRRIDKEVEDELSNNAWQKVVVSRDIDSITPTEWAALDGKTQKEIKTYTSTSAEVKTNVTRWAELNKMYAEDPAKFQKVNMLNEINSLSESDFKDFTKKQQDLISGNDVNQVRTRTDLQVVNGRLRAVGIDPNPPETDKPKSARVGAFFRAFDGRKRQFVEQNNREPNESEVEQIIDKMLVKGTTGIDQPGLGIPFIDEGVFSFEGLEDFQADDPEGFNGVPASDAREIIAAFKNKSNGKIPTDEQVKRLYLLQQKAAKEAKDAK